MASGRQNMDRFRGKKPAEEKVSKKKQKHGEPPHSFRY
jgi:hypothetical protein